MSSHIYCDLCKKSAPMMPKCGFCGVQLCKDCSEGHEMFLIKTSEDVPMCNDCQKRIEEGLEAIIR